MLSFVLFITILVAFLGSAIVLNYLKEQLEAEGVAVLDGSVGARTAGDGAERVETRLRQA